MRGFPTAAQQPVANSQNGERERKPPGANAARRRSAASVPRFDPASASAERSSATGAKRSANQPTQRQRLVEQEGRTAQA